MWHLSVGGLRVGPIPSTGAYEAMSLLLLILRAHTYGGDCIHTIYIYCHVQMILPVLTYFVFYRRALDGVGVFL
jgi:hypothetical protein